MTKLETQIANIPAETLEVMVDKIDNFKEISKEMREEINAYLTSLNISAAKSIGSADLKITSPDINWVNKLIIADNEGGEETPVVSAINTLTRRLYLLKVFALVNVKKAERDEENVDTSLNIGFLKTLSNRLSGISNLDANLHELEAASVATIANKIMDNMNERTEIKETIFNEISSIDEYTKTTPQNLFLPIANYVSAKKKSRKQNLKDKLEERAKKHKHIGKRITEFVVSGE